MDTYQHYESLRSSSERFRVASRPIGWAAGLILLGAAAALGADCAFDEVDLGLSPTDWAVALGAPTLVIAVITIVNWSNARAVMALGRAAADEGLAREGRP